MAGPPISSMKLTSLPAVATPLRPLVSAGTEKAMKEINSTQGRNVLQQGRRRGSLAEFQLGCLGARIMRDRVTDYRDVSKRAYLVLEGGPHCLSRSGYPISGSQDVVSSTESEGRVVKIDVGQREE